MGKGSVAPPAPPDYKNAAKDQGVENLEAARLNARLNNPNVYTPYGSQTVRFDGDQPIVEQRLTPEAQKTLDEQQRVQYQLAALGGKGTQLASNVLDKPFAFGGPAVQTSFDQGGPLQSAPTAGQYGLAGAVNPNIYGQAASVNANSYGQATGIDSNAYGQAGTLNSNAFGQAQSVNPSNYGQAGSVNANVSGQASAINPNDYGQAGGVNAGQYGLAQGGVQGPNLTSSLDLSNVANMPVNAGMTGQQAIMSRLAPYLQQQRTSTETQLINQGLRPGTEAYDNAARLLGQQENDARQQAALQGLGLDMTANQQGYGQALTSGQFGNQAQLSGFGANLQNQQAQNQAITQNFGQGMAAQGLQNQAIAQNFGQGTTAQNMQNQAVAQNFGQNVAAQQLQNQAISQNYGQGSNAQQMQNQAIAQNYGQGLNSQQLANQAVAQNFGQGVTAKGIQNQAIAQNYGQGVNSQQLQNAAIAQNFGQGTSAQQMQNQAIGQNYGQGMSSAQSQNAIEAQRYNQALQGAQFANTAQQQALAQAIQGRQMPLNEISALMSGSQIQNPQFGAYSGSNVVAAPVFGAAQLQAQNAQNTYNQQIAQQNANTGGLFQLGGALLGGAGAAGGFGALFSDRRLKFNIVKVGDHPLGIGIYEYDIFGNRERGVMAQELMQVMPDAVHQHPSGYFMVDYGRL